MTPTHIIIADGTEIPLIAEHHGWRANYDEMLIYVTAVRSSLATSPAKARFSAAE